MALIVGVISNQKKTYITPNKMADDSYIMNYEKYFQIYIKSN